MKITQLKVRTSDDFGQGHYLAPRGKRLHKGIDFVCDPDTMIESHIDGIVTKIGYPYSTDLAFRYVEISDKVFWHRFLYVNPAVKVGDKITVGQVIGSAQNISKKYSTNEKRMMNHVHYEVHKIDKTGKRSTINPMDFLNSSGEHQHG